jgi:sugar lactone lactonase YvrE
VAPPLGPPTPARVFVASDVQGNVYVSHTLRRVVEKYSPKGQRLATIKGFVRPEAIVVDEDGNVYVVDFNQVKIVRAAVQRSRRASPARKNSGAVDRAAGTDGRR